MTTTGITARWSTANKTGKMPGLWGSSSDAERAAKDFMEKYPQVTSVGLYHSTGGFLREVTKRG